ncbi:MAG: hypothetical protein GAK28_03208 [Luteibacter sp.]|uniref:hypothetical protein n=1 Tax=Luteibacter sp. TaxID=1886636 RepID=UPI0013813505|nr:hypothetical protein [Luteibacter sp.]KAF1005456.1 MAG: hypothetical protein GAK28_03208 [Luteibacter sp.]
MTRLVVTIDDMRLKGGQNAREHYLARARRTKRERQAAHWLLLDAKRPALPVTVRLVRVAPRALDDDNLSGVFKGIRDGVADAYGIADNDKALIRFACDQERGPPHTYGVRIEVESRSA